MQSARGRDHRRACDEGSHSSAADDTAEVQRGSYGRISKGRVGDSYLQGLSSGEEELHGEALLDQRLLCQYSWIRREDDPGVYQKPRRGRKALGADASGGSLTIAPSGGFHQTTRSAGGI